MSPADSITQWIGRLRAGDAEAAQRLWERYFQRLVRFARRKLRGTPRLPADGEDIALNALDSFFRGAMCGRFPKLRDRDSLWPLLVLITARKAYDLLQHERCQKRGGGAVLGEAALCGPSDSSTGEYGLDQIIGREPTPEFAARMADECRRLLDLLDAPQLRSIALWKAEGYTNAEIARKLGCVTTTVERRIRLIRRIWEKERTP
jgi:DNA-directed RNA polymerase specialized sigma24 family protein